MCSEVLHSINIQRKWPTCLFKLLTKPHKFMYPLPHCLPLVDFLHSTRKTFEFNLRGGVLTLDDSRDRRHPTEQVAVSWDDSLVSCPWHNREGPAAAEDLLDSCLCCIADRPASLRQVLPWRYQPYSRSTALCSTAVLELGPWQHPKLMYNTQVLHLVSPV